MKWTRLGHEIRLIPPRFVKPYVESNKNDANDAEAICEAASRPSMRYVALKTIDQQAGMAIAIAKQNRIDDEPVCRHA